MPQNAKFWDRIAEKYARRPIADEAAYRKKLAVTQGYFNPEMQVLEFGCGTGSTAIEHAEHVAHITALDISTKMIGIATTKTKVSAIDNITYEVGSIADFEAEPASFDAVLGLSILHLLDNWRDTVTKVHDLLRPGGIFVSSTACIGDMSPVFKVLLPVLSVTPFVPSVEIFSAEELKAAMTAAGFEIDYEWQPAPKQALFLIAKKPASAG